MKVYDHKFLGGILLVAGTTVGAGMLALPIKTGMGGFFPASALFIIGFVYMLLALFMLLEANLYEKNMESNIISMAKKHLGWMGQFVGWFSFLFLYYAVTAAYMDAGGSLIAKLFVPGEVTKSQSLMGIYAFILVFGSVVFFGAWLIDYVNRFLMLGLIAAYFAMVIFVVPHIEVTNLLGADPVALLPAVPIVMLAFTSHVILPSLRIYLKDDVPLLRRVLMFGSLVPLIFYLVWEMTILGVIPLEGANGLAAVAHSETPVADLTFILRNSLGLTWLAVTVGFFSFFALVTSFLAVALGLTDFLADGFQIKKTIAGRFWLLILSIGPPMFFTIYYPGLFLMALGYAGVFVAILYGILPPLIVWRARYMAKLTAKYTMPGGKPMIFVVLIGGILVVAFQIASTLKLFSS